MDTLYGFDLQLFAEGVNFEEILKKHAGEDGSIPADAIGKAASALSSAVGRAFVDKARYNAKLDEIETLKAEKQTAEDNATAAAKWEKKYRDKEAELDKYRADTDAKETLSKKKAAYKKLLEEQGIDARRHEAILRATVFDDMRLTEDGALDKAEDLKAAIDSDWGDFRVEKRTQGAKVETPPKGGDGGGANPRAAQLARQFHERRYGANPAAAKGEGE